VSFRLSTLAGTYYIIFREKLKRKLDESGGMTYPVEEHFQPPSLEIYPESAAARRRQSAPSAIESTAVKRRNSASEDALMEKERKRQEKELKKEQKVQEKENKRRESHNRGRRERDEGDMRGRRSPDRRASDGGHAYNDPMMDHKLPKLRQKKKLDSDEGDSQYDDSGRSNTPVNDVDASGSIIKRRKRGELQISVDGGGSHGTSMGPPEDTPGSRYRLRSVGPLTSMLGSLESPFGGLDSSLSILGGLDKHTMFGDPFSAETPGKYFDAPLSKPMSTLTSDSLRFDFDEVVQHFPSPKTGAGSSPMRWGYNVPGSAETADGQSVFTFPDSTTAGASYASFNKPSAREEEEQDSYGKQSLYSKKMRKAYKKDAGSSATASADAGELEMSSPMGMLASPQPVRHHGRAR
jgi:hypothetical protein